MHGADRFSKRSLRRRGLREIPLGISVLACLMWATASASPGAQDLVQNVAQDLASGNGAAGLRVQHENLRSLAHAMPMRLLLEPRHATVRQGVLLTTDADDVDAAISKAMRAQVEGRIEAYFDARMAQTIRFGVRARVDVEAFRRVYRSHLLGEAEVDQLQDSPLLTHTWRNGDVALRSAWRGRQAAFLLCGNAARDAGLQLDPPRRERRLAQSPFLESWFRASALSALFDGSEAGAEVGARWNLDVRSRIESPPSVARPATRETIEVRHEALRSTILAAKGPGLSDIATRLPEDTVLAARISLDSGRHVGVFLQSLAKLVDAQTLDAIVRGLLASPLTLDGRLPSECGFYVLPPHAGVLMPEPGLIFRVDDRSIDARAVLRALELAMRKSFDVEAQLPVADMVSKIRRLGRGDTAIPYLRLRDCGLSEDDAMGAGFFSGGGYLSALQIGDLFVLGCHPRSLRSMRELDDRATTLAARLEVDPAGLEPGSTFDLWVNVPTLVRKTSSFNEIAGPIAIASAVIIRNLLVGAVAAPNAAAAIADAMRPRHFRALLESAGVERVRLLQHDVAKGRIDLERRGSGLLSPALWNAAAQTWHAMKVFRALRAD